MTDLNTLPGYALRRAANTMMAELGERLAPLGLRISDATVLILIATRSELTASAIARELDIGRANLVPLLKRLDDAGLVRRLPLDGKSQAVVLTDTGTQAVTRARAIVTEFEAGLLARVPHEHRDHLLPALHALYFAP